MANPKLKQVAPAPIDFPRADPAALAKFDPSTKRCTMGCGQHAADPRSKEECAFLCDECVTVAPAAAPALPGAVDEKQEHLRYVQWHKGEFGQYPVQVDPQHLRIWMGAKREAASDLGALAASLEKMQRELDQAFVNILLSRLTSSQREELDTALTARIDDCEARFTKLVDSHSGGTAIASYWRTQALSAEQVRDMVRYETMAAEAGHPSGSGQPT